MISNSKRNWKTKRRGTQDTAPIEKNMWVISEELKGTLLCVNSGVKTFLSLHYGSL